MFFLTLSISFFYLCLPSCSLSPFLLSLSLITLSLPSYSLSPFLLSLSLRPIRIYFCVLRIVVTCDICSSIYVGKLFSFCLSVSFPALNCRIFLFYLTKVTRGVIRGRLDRLRTRKIFFSI